MASDAQTELDLDDILESTWDELESARTVSETTTTVSAANPGSSTIDPTPSDDAAPSGAFAAARAAAAAGAMPSSTPGAADRSASAPTSAQSEPRDLEEALQQATERLEASQGDEGSDAANAASAALEGLIASGLQTPIRELREGYEKWLASDPTCTDAEMSTYRKQLAVLKRLESSAAGDFDSMGEVLDELQALGEPPPEVIALLSSAELDDAGDGETDEEVAGRLQALMEDLQRLETDITGANPGDAAPGPDGAPPSAEEFEQLMSELSRLGGPPGQGGKPGAAGGPNGEDCLVM